MATHLSVDSELIELALELSGERTRKAVVTLALEEFIARRRRHCLLDLMGELDWDPAFDLRRERERTAKPAPVPRRSR